MHGPPGVGAAYTAAAARGDPWDTATAIMREAVPVHQLLLHTNTGRHLTPSATA